MPASVIHLVSASDARFSPGLLTALGTALGCASGRFDYRVTVFDGGISNEDWNYLNSCLYRIANLRGIVVDLRRLVSDTKTLGILPARRGSSLTYARLVLPHLLDDEFFVYIDSDVVCFRGIEDFWTSLDPSVALTAACDPLGHVGRDGSAREHLPPTARHAPYFNAGIIGINAARWRNSDVKRKMEQLVRQVKNFEYVDQSLLNILFHGEWAEVHQFNNFVLTLERCAHIRALPEPANLHFVGPRKPWFSRYSSFYRIVPDRLFDMALMWVNGGGNLSSREVDGRSVSKARRKALMYLLFHPKRSHVYRTAIRTAETGVTVANELWDRFWLASPKSSYVEPPEKNDL